MMLYKPQDLMILKLTNPEDFESAESYWSQDDWVQYEGHLKDTDQFPGYGGEPYGDDYYFLVHSTYTLGSMGIRGEDDEIKLTHPWVAIISGDSTMLAVIKRFRAYREMCDWLENPNDDDIIYVY